MYTTSEVTGQLTTPTDEGIKNFWRWFNGVQQKGKDGKKGANDRGNNRADNGAARSWTRDHAGRPRVFYHGTADGFSTFDLYHKNRKDEGWLGRGVYATQQHIPFRNVCQPERRVSESNCHAAFPYFRLEFFLGHSGELLGPAGEFVTDANIPQSGV
ncbi:MAG: hypothetical protein H0X43_13715 [Nitrosospira sp.]|nr:hypothetical protein [Nitrosospira sp.]